MRLNRPESLLRSACAAAALALAFAWAAGLSACKTVDVSDPDGGSDSDTAVGTAVLRITNKIELFPDSLDFFLFPGASVDFSNAANGKRAGRVGVGRTGVFTVAAGTWKLAFRNQAGVMTPMRALDSDEWVKATLKKGGDYSLILSSEGQDIRWDPTFPTDPPIQ